jgi:hypothetical protein
MAVNEAAQAALAEEQFSLIAKILDKAELDVSHLGEPADRQARTAMNS